MYPTCRNAYRLREKFCWWKCDRVWDLHSAQSVSNVYISSFRRHAGNKILPTFLGVQYVYVCMHTTGHTGKTLDRKSATPLWHVAYTCVTAWIPTRAAMLVLCMLAGHDTRLVVESDVYFSSYPAVSYRSVSMNPCWNVVSRLHIVVSLVESGYPSWHVMTLLLQHILEDVFEHHWATPWPTCWDRTSG